MSASSRFAPRISAGAIFVLASSLSFPALAYDDVPDPVYFGVEAAPEPGYAPGRSAARVYGYGPVYRVEPQPRSRRDNEPLGTYAPNEPSNLSPSRGFFLGIERKAGGD